MRLGLADEVCAHIRRLGVNAAAHAVEHCNYRTAQRIARKGHSERRVEPRYKVFAYRSLGDILNLTRGEPEDAVHRDNAQKREARDAQPHYRAALERNLQCLAEVTRLARLVCHAHVRIGRYFHTYPARGGAHYRAYNKGDCRLPAYYEKYRHRNDRAYYRDELILVAYERVRSYADCARYFAHTVGALFQLFNAEVVEYRVRNG